MPEDLLGPEMDLGTPSTHWVAHIFLLDVNLPPVTIVTRDTLLVAAKLPPGDSEARVRLGIDIVSKFMMRRLEDSGVFHVHGSAAFHEPTKTLLLLIGPTGGGKSLVTLFLRANYGVHFVCDSYTAFSFDNRGSTFYAGPSYWLFREEVRETANEFFSARRPRKDWPIPLGNGSTRWQYDVSDCMVTSDRLRPDRLFVFWPQVKREGVMSQTEPLSADKAVDLLSADIGSWLKPKLSSNLRVNKVILPSDWSPYDNPERVSAYRTLMEDARAIVQVSGSLSYVVEEVAHQAGFK